MVGLSIRAVPEAEIRAYIPQGGIPNSGNPQLGTFRFWDLGFRDLGFIRFRF